MTAQASTTGAASIGWLAAIGLVTFGAAAAGGLASAGAGSFYATLAKPVWAPPAWLFGPVWTALYALIAIAAWLVVCERGWLAGLIPLLLYAVQLVVNALWTWFFFRWRTGAGSFADIVVLVILVVATTVLFWRVRPLAGALMLPYLAWISFATVLTWTVWRANPGTL